jgi:phosphoglycerate dehydrogenase-like enzyme
VRDGVALEQRIGEADVLVISGLWRNDLLPRAKRLRFIQSIGAGTEHGVRLASARGVNARAVAEHVMALMLALARRLPEARDNQAKRVWRGMVGDLTQRENELGGKTLLIVGLGQIGGRLAQLAKAFDMRVVRKTHWRLAKRHCAPSRPKNGLERFNRISSTGSIT